LTHKITKPQNNLKTISKPIKMSYRKALKIFIRLLLFFLFMVGVYVVSAILIPKITVEKELGQKEEVSIFISTNGVHTDIVLPVKNKHIDWSKKIRFENTIKNDSTARFVSLGWGDKGFYLETPEWSDLKISVALKAATGLGNTAIHATFYNEMNESETCKQIKISEAQYLRLIKYIDDSFAKDQAKNYVNIITKANYGKTDAFYEANESYSIFYTCNTWANNGLKSCGQKCCFWTPTDKGIFDKYNTN
jgi:uncharacterized protein (TIGR02117 family)